MDEQYLADHYEDVVIKRDINYANVKQGLEITRDFIIANNLILIGGMAIDMALRANKKDGIYTPDKLPDYDFVSPDTLSHSSELGQLICKKGLPRPDIINAMHTTTRRVRVEFVVVADMGYCPQNIFETLPYIEYDGMRVIHPHFQMMDIHRALCYPFEIPTMPVVFHRWKRDMKRYDKLHDAYPITEKKSTSVTMKTVTLDKTLLRGSCITGWAAFSYWQTNKLDTVKIPEGEPIHVLSDNFQQFTTIGKNVRYVESRMGKMQRSVFVTISDQEYEVFDNLGEKVSAEKIGGLFVANMQHVMLLLLVKKYLDFQIQPNIKAFCISTYIKSYQMVQSGTVPGILPSINVYGSASWSDAYIINRREFAARINDIKLDRPDRPKNIYPSAPKCKTKVDFDYSKSPYFAISGKDTHAFAVKKLEYFGETDLVTENISG